MKVVSLVGARPQFVKEAMVSRAARRLGAWRHVLVHSGQHYDCNMSDIFFQQLEIPAPDHFLGVGSGSHGKQTGEVLVRFEEILLSERPDAVLVYGDTNTTLAGALGAVKLRIPVAHVEAGLRQEPRDMPEEINRVLTDRASTLLFCCSERGRTVLADEGIRQGVHVVGDVMYDLYQTMVPSLDPDAALRRWGLRRGAFALATLHRDFNVDRPEPLEGILRGLCRVQEETGWPVLLPLHPRTRKRVEEFGLQPFLEPLHVTEPLGYLELLSCLQECALVLTDSGGFQKEAYFAGKRAVVLMPDTAWRELVETGWNLLAAPEEGAIWRASQGALDPCPYPQELYGEGRAAEFLVAVLAGASFPS